jgi:hypothetical protein
MPEQRPVERERAKRGLGARSPEGETTPANPKGRLKHIGNPGAEGSRSRKSSRAPRAEHARRRTKRDNPAGES